MSRRSSKRKRKRPTTEVDQFRTKIRRDGRRRRLCTAEGCTNIVNCKGVCRRHGAKIKYKLCSSEGCAKHVQEGGVCIRHGTKVKRCSKERCTNTVVKGGVCSRHGAYHNTNDESTAFGSEFEQTTATLPQPNDHNSGPCIIGQEGRRAPGEVAIVCQEILEK